MHCRPTHPVLVEDAARGRAGASPPIPRTSGFVPVHLMVNALAHVLALALHRDAAGAQRPYHSSGLLAAAMRDGEVECDAVAVPWIPPLPAADAAMAEAWGTRTGHEGGRHRHLRAAATGLLAALAPGAEIQAERPRNGHGRRLRPDLQVRIGRRGFILAEVGAVEGDGVAALLLPEPGARASRAAAPVTHVVVLPFAGQRADAARGYVFRRARAPALRAPTRAEIRAAWTAFAGRPAPRGRGT